MEKIGTYEVLETLHSGPRNLYKVRDTGGRILALKTAPLETLTEEMRERFFREARTSAALDHPNLIRVYEWGEAGGLLYQTMDLLDGLDLAKVLASGRQFTWEGRRRVMEQVCDGLQYAHERGLVHRDIKPANIFVEKSARVRILDFGMARVDSSNLTQDGAALGTITYMAPEQMRGEKCTPAADVFSAGIVFYQLCSGRHPFAPRDSNVGMILSAILFSDPPPLSEVAPDAPKWIDAALRHALEKDPARRTQSVAELKRALFSGATPAAAPAPQPEPGKAAAAEDGDRTVAVRVLPPKTAQPAAAVPPPAPPKTRPPAATRSPLTARFCASCTHANPMSAAFCERCGQPLMARRPSVASEPGGPSKLALAFVVSGAALLAAIAILVVLSR